MNFVPGQTVANTVLTRVGPAGAVCLWANVALDLVVDLDASFTAGSAYRPVVPTRVVDTRY